MQSRKVNSSRKQQGRVVQKGNCANSSSCRLAPRKIFFAPKGGKRGEEFPRRRERPWSAEEGRGVEKRRREEGGWVGAIPSAEAVVFVWRRSSARAPPSGRAGEIRTRDLLRPRQTRYQAALRPDPPEGTERYGGGMSSTTRKSSAAAQTVSRLRSFQNSMFGVIFGATCIL